MAAYDNVQLPAPPNIAQAGNYAQMLMQGLSQLPEQYYKGQQAQYQQRQNNLFQNGVPMNAQGQPDYAAMMKQMVQSGGSPVAAQVLPMLQKQPFLDAALKDYQGGSNTPVNTSPAAATSAASPSSITGNTGQPRPTQVAQTNGGDTVNSLSVDKGVDLDGFLGKYPAVRQYLNRDLTPAQAKNVGKLMDAYKGGGGTPTGNTSVPQKNPVVQQNAGAEDQSNPHITPSGVGGSSAISPQPTSGAGAPSSSGTVAGAPQPWSQGGNVDTRFNDAYGGGASSMVPDAWKGREEQYAEVLNQRAEAIRKQAKAMGVAGIPTKSNEDQAADLDRQATAIREQLGKPANVTPEMRNLASGATQRGEELKGEIEASNKQIAAIDNQAVAAQTGQQKLQLAKRILNDDNFYSGPGESIVNGYKQIAASTGIGDPNAANAPEAFRKSVNDLLTEQVRSLAGSGVGRVLQTEVQTMRDSIASMKITPSTNRLLLEEVDRVYKAQTDIQNLAKQYAEANGHLDHGFPQAVARYFKQHPMFSADELRDPRLIAPPVAPPGMNQAQAQVWARKRGLSSGDPVKTQNGKIGWIP